MHLQEDYVFTRKTEKSTESMQYYTYTYIYLLDCWIVETKLDSLIADFLLALFIQSMTLAT